VTLSADDLTACAGRYADPSQVLTFTRSGDGLTVTSEQLIQPGSWQPAIQPPSGPGPAVPLTFLAKDIALVNGARVPFVRDASGRVQWVSSGARLVPRVAGD
jgi:hypothetical protein